MAFCTKQLSFFTIFAIAALAFNARAIDEHVSMSATTEFASLHAGGSGVLAITLRIDEGWHTYWPGISDSGFGVKLAIKTSDPITLDDPIWPTPKRYLQPGDILDHVYEDEVMVLVPFQIAEDASADDLLVFDVAADYLVCKEICLPGKVNASTTITIIDESSERSPTSLSNEIRKAYESRPKELNPKAEDVRVQWVANAAAIIFREATKIEFFPSTGCTGLADPVVGGLSDSSRLVIQFAQRTDKVLSGRIRVYERTGIVDYDIHLNEPD